MKGFVILELLDGESRLWFSESKGKEIVFSSKVYKNEGLQDAVKTLGILGQSTVLIVPRDLVTVRFVEVPSIEQEEIKSMVEFQAQKELPFSKEETVVGFRSLGSYKEGYSWILLAIAHKDKLHEKIKFVESVGLEVVRISLSTEILFLWARGLVNKEASNLILNANKDNAELLIIDQGRPVFSRSFSSDLLLQEIERSFEAYRREKLGSFPEEGIITGIFENPPILSKSIEAKLNIRTKVFEFDIAEFESFETLEIDLTPKELKESRLKKVKRKDLIRLSILFSLALFLIFSFVSLRLFVKRQYLLALDRKIRSIESEAIEAEKMIKKINAVQLQIKQKGSAVFCLSELYKIIPDNITLVSLSYDESKMVLQGSSRDMSYVLNFITTLERTQAFYNVELKFATKRSSSEGEFTDFQIICLVES